MDLGSGMPTQGHFHNAAPHAKVLYTDIDAMTVAYAREVIGDNPSVVYLQTDIRSPAEVLQAAEQLFGRERRVAIGFIGLSYFLDDDSLAKIAQTLHAWAAPGSVMALSFGHVRVDDDKAREKLETFRRNSAQIFIRDEAQVAKLLAPWKINAINPLASWLGVDQLVQEGDREGIGAEMYGVLLAHEG
jgi:O-methyltransferase involved in polyketide biosynthesis